MSNRLNKKGISEIFSVVLIVGMSIVALTLLTTFLFGILGETKTQLAPVVSCLTLQSKIVSACSSDGNLELEVLREISDDEISSFKFLIESSGKRESIYCGKDCGSCNIQGIGQTKKFYFNSEYVPGEITLFANEKCNLGTKKVVAC